MFLSKLILDLRNRSARHDLARPYELHRTLMVCYPHERVEKRCDLLFRAETSRNGPPTILVQTPDEPNWSRLPEGYIRGEAQAKPLDLAFASGQRLRFRLRANPTKRVAAKNERLGGVMAGKRVGLNTETDQLRWLLRKAEAGGFQIPGHWVDACDPEINTPIQLPNFRVDVSPEGRIRNDKPGHDGDFLAVRFDGVLVVTDPSRFVHALATGIGSGKAFGFGLLSLARAEG